MTIKDVPVDFIIDQLTEKQKADIIIRYLILNTIQLPNENKKIFIIRLANMFNYSRKNIEWIIYSKKKNRPKPVFR